jgi:hypothetical protein
MIMQRSVQGRASSCRVTITLSQRADHGAQAQCFEPIEDVVRCHRGSTPVRGHLGDDTAHLKRIRRREFAKQVPGVKDSAMAPDILCREVGHIGGQQDIDPSPSGGGCVDVVTRVRPCHRVDQWAILGRVYPSSRGGGPHLLAEDEHRPMT